MSLLLLLAPSGIGVSGTTTSSSTTAGALTVTAALTATSTAASSSVGSLTATAVLTTTTAAASTASGAVTNTATLSALTASNSALTGSLTNTSPEVALAGLVEAVSTLTAVLTSHVHVASVSAATSTTAGSLTVLAPPQVLPPIADSADGAWTTDLGDTNLVAAIDETTPSDSDYIRSELAPASSACRLKLATGNDPNSSVGHVIKWRVGKDTTGGPQINVAISLRQGGGDTLGGGALVASFARNDVDALTTFQETLSGAEADAITDYSDLYLELTASQV